MFTGFFVVYMISLCLAQGFSSSCGTCRRNCQFSRRNHVFGPLAEIPKKSLIPRDEFARLMVPTAHITDLGFCDQVYTMSPCPLHRDCIHCENLVCVKGDEAGLLKVMHTNSAMLQITPGVQGLPCLLTPNARQALHSSITFNRTRDEEKTRRLRQHLEDARELLIDAIELRMFNRYTRQSRFKHERIRHTFQLRKTNCRRKA